MNINNGHGKKNITKCVSVLVSLLVLIGLGIFLYFTYENRESTSVDNKKDSQVQSNEKQPSLGDVDYEKPTQEQVDAVPEKDNSTTSKPLESIPVTISHAGGSPLRVGVLIGELLSSGTCMVELLRSDSVVFTETVDVFPSANSTTCKGFSIAVSSLDKGGYDLKITVRSNGRVGISSMEVFL